MDEYAVGRDDIGVGLQRMDDDEQFWGLRSLGPDEQRLDELVELRMR